jgi:peptide-methionine (S)-S-oxide reductase
MIHAGQKPRRPRRHLSLWWAFGFVLLLIGWWELSAPRFTPLAPQPVNSGLTAVPAGAQVAIFAGGCFWCTESDFDAVGGVLSTTSGYTGGKTANPTYEEVSSHATGHAEAVRIVFDPKRVSYSQLLDLYWHSIDPTVRNQQFCDHGTPYRTAIFTVDEAQWQQAQASLQALNLSKPFNDAIQTQIERASDFYPAEDIHQDYHQKNPVRYEFYRSSCGRDARLRQIWGDLASR